MYNEILYIFATISFECYIGSMEEGAENDECAETSRHLNSGESIDTAQGFEEASNDTSNVEVLAMVNGPIAQALAEAERRLAALRVRRNSFLEVLEDRTTTFITNMTQQAQHWIYDRAMTLRMRYAMKTLAQSVRTDRTRSVFELRTAELQQHENRVNSHVQAVTESVEGMIVCASRFADPGSSIVATFYQGIEIIKQKVDTINVANPPLDCETKELKLKSYGALLTNLRRTLEQGLDEAMENQREEFESRLRDARAANLLLFSGIEMFFEGGRFSPSEASTFTAALGQLDDMVSSCSGRLEQAFSERRLELLLEADRNIANVLKEFKEDGQKTVDNFKSTSGKKK